MKVTRSMIDKDLRFSGYVMKITFPPSKRILKRLHKVTKLMTGKNIKGFECLEEYIPSRDQGRNIRIRIYRPEKIEDELPGFLYIHGGGYLMMVPESDHYLIEEFLKTKDCVIISPDYRLSVEAPYPAAIFDCYDTLEWMVNNSSSLKFNPTQLFVGGASAGGGLTAALTLMARDMGKIQIAFQMPIYPMLDYRMDTHSMKDNNAPAWSEKHTKIAWDLYLRDVNEGEITSYASPAINNDYSKLPPTMTFVGELDPFHDETVEYINNLEKTGIEVNYKVFKGAYHGFDRIAKKSKVSQLAREYIREQFSYAVENYFTLQP